MESTGLGLQEAVEAIRTDLLAARDSGEGADIRFPVAKVTVQLQVVATREGGGKAGFRVPIVNVEVGASGSVSAERTSTVTIEFGGPVDRDGLPVKIAKASDERKG